MWHDIGVGLLRTLAYVGVGGFVLMFGYFVHDILTPGKLGEQSNLICNKRNINATLVVSSNLVAAGLIVAMSIWTTHSSFGQGITTTAIFGAVGVLILSIAEVIVDKLTPGELGQLLVEDKFHPVAAFMAATNIVVGIIVAVSIS